jgi:hypothetical protein
VHYSGSQPWSEDKLDRSIPGWPNEARQITEHWAAYVNDEDFGLGAYVPAASKITCYRFGDGKRELGACSYFAPLVRFAIKPKFEFQYDVFVTVGQVDEIRAAFAVQHKRR